MDRHRRSMAGRIGCADSIRPPSLARQPHRPRWGPKKAGNYSCPMGLSSYDSKCISPANRPSSQGNASYPQVLLHSPSPAPSTLTPFKRCCPATIYSMDEPTLTVAALPPEVDVLLWPYDRSGHTELPLSVVSAAVMDRGDLSAMRWLIRTAGRDALRVVLPRVARRLSPRSLALWQCVLDTDVAPPPQTPWVAA